MRDYLLFIHTRDHNTNDWLIIAVFLSVTYHLGNKREKDRRNKSKELEGGDKNTVRKQYKNSSIKVTKLEHKDHNKKTGRSRQEKAEM